MSIKDYEKWIRRGAVGLRPTVVMKSQNLGSLLRYRKP